jgi:aryl-alcohol dehydrogenase-like predicted oxidoreductase
MKYRKVGKWGLKVSCLGLGSFFTIGDTLEENVSKELIKTAYGKGINFFDTANGYGKGEAERLVGKYLKDYRRSSIVLLTKVFGTMGPGPNERGLSMKGIKEQC